MNLRLEPQGSLLGLTHGRAAAGASSLTRAAYGNATQAINSGKPKPPPATKNILCYSAPAAGAKPSTATDEAIATCLYFKTSGKVRGHQEELTALHASGLAPVC